LGTEGQGFENNGNGSKIAQTRKKQGQIQLKTDPMMIYVNM